MLPTARIRRRRDLDRIGSATWSLIWVLTGLSYCIYCFHYILVEDDNGEVLQYRQDSFASDTEFALPAMISEEKLVERLGTWPEADSSTPLVVLENPGTSPELLEAARRSKILPATHVTLLSINGDGNILLPPPQTVLDGLTEEGRGEKEDSGIGGGRGERELVPRATLGLASVMSGMVDRLFLVTPATDLRELLLMKGKDVTFKHIVRTDPERELCNISSSSSSSARVMEFNFSSSSLHMSEVQEETRGFKAFALAGNVAIPLDAETEAHPLAGINIFKINTSLSVIQQRQAPRPPSSTACCSACKVTSAGEEDKGARVRGFSVWKGELADADNEKEVLYDARQLIDAMTPLGPYVLSFDLSYFSNRFQSLEPADECLWLLHEERARQCLLPLANDNNSPAAVTYPVAVRNLVAVVMSNQRPPRQLPDHCLKDFMAFRNFFLKSITRYHKISFARRQPLEAAAEMCYARHHRFFMNRAEYQLETREVLRLNRRMKTVKTFLRIVKQNLRPPALILLHRAPSVFSLPISHHAKHVEDEVKAALTGLRRSPEDVKIVQQTRPHPKKKRLL